MLPFVLLYSTGPPVTAAPPDLKVTTGVSMASEAVNESIMLSPALAIVFVELLEAMPTLLSVGKVVSGNEVLKYAAGGKEKL